MITHSSYIVHTPHTDFLFLVNVPTPTVSTPTRKPAKRKTVKYVRPYQPPVATTPQLASEPIEATGSITQPDTQTTASEPIETTGSITLPDTQITAQAIPLHQPVEQSASAPNVHLQQEQHNAIEIDESVQPPPLHASLTLTYT